MTNLNLGNNTGALVSINPDSLEDVKVLTSNYQAEYGRTPTLVNEFVYGAGRGGVDIAPGVAAQTLRHDRHVFRCAQH